MLRQVWNYFRRHAGPPLLLLSGIGMSYLPLGEGDIHLAFWTALVGAFAGGAGAAMNASSKPTTTTDYTYTPRSNLLSGTGFEFFGLNSELTAQQRAQKAQWNRGVTNLLELLEQPGLPPEVKQAMLASVASGYSGAMGTEARRAALMGGPALLSPASVAASRGKAQADMMAQFAMADLQARQKSLSMFQPILSFLNNMDAVRYGAPSQTRQTYDPDVSSAAAFMSGFAGGMGQGMQVPGMGMGPQSSAPKGPAGPPGVGGYS